MAELPRIHLPVDGGCVERAPEIRVELDVAGEGVPVPGEQREPVGHEAGQPGERGDGAARDEDPSLEGRAAQRRPALLRVVEQHRQIERRQEVQRAEGLAVEDRERGPRHAGGGVDRALELHVGVERAPARAHEMEPARLHEEAPDAGKPRARRSLDRRARRDVAAHAIVRRPRGHRRRDVRQRARDGSLDPGQPREAAQVQVVGGDLHLAGDAAPGGRIEDRARQPRIAAGHAHLCDGSVAEPRVGFTGTGHDAEQAVRAHRRAVEPRREEAREALDLREPAAGDLDVDVTPAAARAARRELDVDARQPGDARRHAREARRLREIHVLAAKLAGDLASGDDERALERTGALEPEAVDPHAAGRRRDARDLGADLAVAEPQPHAGHGLRLEVERGRARQDLTARPVERGVEPGRPQGPRARAFTVSHAEKPARRPLPHADAST